jgi:ABC-type transport system substrate-binding protein
MIEGRRCDLGRYGRIGLALVVAALLACACGSSDSSDSSAGEKGTPGGTLTFATAFPIEGLDGHQYQGNNFDVLDQIYEPLVRYSGDGDITPGLATSHTVSADGRTLTFNLRQGVTFSDGTPLDSKAVKFNFDKWIGLSDHAFLGINGGKVTAPDPQTVVLKLPKPYYPAIYELTFARPVPRQLQSAAGDDVRVSLEDIEVAIGDARIVRGASIELPDGAFVGVIGPNGCGKTTLMRAIYRSLRPAAGTIDIGGQDPWDVSAREAAQRTAVVARRLLSASSSPSPRSPRWGVSRTSAALTARPTPTAGSSPTRSPRSGWRSWLTVRSRPCRATNASVC